MGLNKGANSKRTKSKMSKKKTGFNRLPKNMKRPMNPKIIEEKTDNQSLDHSRSSVPVATCESSRSQPNLLIEDTEASGSVNPIMFSPIGITSSVSETENAESPEPSDHFISDPVTPTSRFATTSSGTPGSRIRRINVSDTHLNDEPSFEGNQENNSMEEDLDNYDLTVENLPSFREPGLNQESVPGRRLVDPIYFINQIRAMDKHTYKCNPRKFGQPSGVFLFVREERVGLFSRLHYQCNSCYSKKVIDTDRVPENLSKKSVKAENQLSVNDDLVWGFMAIGSGFSNVQEVMAVLGVPVMSESTYSKIENRIGSIWQDRLTEQLIENGKEEYRLATMAGDFCEAPYDKTCFISVIVDGGWSKRSHGHSYNASSGLAVIIGKRTGKLLYVDVRNKYCAKCSFHKKRNQEPKPHKCFKNWKGSSSSMEPNILTAGFNESIGMHNLQYRIFIGDGDSSVAYELKNKVAVYGEKIKKDLCSNHAVKNFTKALYEFKADKQKGAGNILNKNVIRKLSKGTRAAIAHHSITDKSVTALVRDLLNAPKHCFGNHEECDSYFCKNVGENSGKWDSLPPNVRTGLSTLTTVKLVDKAPTLIAGQTSNRAENTMSLVAKHSGGKQINRSNRGSYQHRVYGASLNQIKGPEWGPFTYKAQTARSPNIIWKRLCKRVALRNKRSAISKTTLFERKKLFVPEKKTVQDGSADYGCHARQDDFSCETMNLLCSEKLEELQVDEQKQHHIEQATQSQADSIEWQNNRKHRLTASNFARVCKLRPTTETKSTVKSILYPKDAESSKRMETYFNHGHEGEKAAKKILREVHEINVVDCGLFVDLDHGFLGASPDGLVGNNAIVEIKSPYSFKSIDPLDIPSHVDEQNMTNKNKKQFCCTYNYETNQLNLKTKDAYYYQVQGQLNITRREICYFVIYTEKGIHVEKINRDQTFWNTQMLPKLIKFYKNCLLPEIVNSRFARSMPIREPDYVINAIAAKSNDKKTEETSVPPTKRKRKT